MNKFAIDKHKNWQICKIIPGRGEILEKFFAVFDVFQSAQKAIKFYSAVNSGELYINVT